MSGTARLIRGRRGGRGSLAQVNSWLLGEVGGNLIDFPNFNHVDSDPAGDWTWDNDTIAPANWDLANAAAPNGATEAMRFIPGTGEARHYAAIPKNRPSADHIHTFGAFVKRAAGALDVLISLESVETDGETNSDGNFAEICVNLATGALRFTDDNASATLVSYSIRPAAQSFYWIRIAARLNIATGTHPKMRGKIFAAGAGSDGNTATLVTGDSSAGLYMWRGRLAVGNEL